MRLFETETPPEAALADLLGARAPLSDPDTAWAALEAALERAPDDAAIRLAAYRMCFYAHRFAEARPHARALRHHAARQLNIAGDWRDLRHGDAAFAGHERLPGLYLQALIAEGYCALRLGETGSGLEMLACAAALDPSDRFGARLLMRAAAVAEED